MEFLFSALIVAFAGYILFKNLKKKTTGGCDCGSCSSHCPHYKDKK